MIVACALALSSLSAQAEVVTLNFQGWFNEIRYLDGTQLSSVDLAGTPLSVGDRFSGTVSYDTTAPVVEWTPVIYGTTSNPLVPAASVTLDSSGVTSSANPGSARTAVLDSNGSTWSYDSDRLVPFPVLVNGPLTMLWLDLYFSTTYLNDSKLPTSVSLSDVSSSSFNVHAFDNQGQELLAFGKLTSLSSVTAVPEPSTWLMMLGGLALVGFGASRQRK